jgi:hypothetical protein
MVFLLQGLEHSSHFLNVCCHVALMLRLCLSVPVLELKLVTSALARAHTHMLHLFGTRECIIKTKR